MKKHGVTILNILLVLVILGAVFYVMWMATISTSRGEVETAPTAVPASEATADEAPPKERFRVGIVQHADKPTSQMCYEGFVTELSALGILEQIDIDYVLEEDNDRCITEIERLVGEECDLIYAIGPFAATHAAAATSEIPIVFAAVSDPEEVGLVSSNEVPGGNVTGVSSFTPCFEQIDLVPLLLPNAEKIGAMYCMTDEDAVVQAIIAEKEAESAEVGLTYERYPILTEDDVEDCLASMDADGVDVIYIPIDTLVYSHFDAVAAFSLENNIPIICGDEKALSRGGFATSLINYESIGKHAGDLVDDILFEKKDVSSLPVVYKYECYNIVNQTVMKDLGLKLSADAAAAVELRSYEE